MKQNNDTILYFIAYIYNVNYINIVLVQCTAKQNKPDWTQLIQFITVLHHFYQSIFVPRNHFA